MEVCESEIAFAKRSLSRPAPLAIFFPHFHRFIYFNGVSRPDKIAWSIVKKRHFPSEVFSGSERSDGESERDRSHLRRDGRARISCLRGRFRLATFHRCEKSPVIPASGRGKLIFRAGISRAREDKCRGSGPGRLPRARFGPDV